MAQTTFTKDRWPIYDARQPEEWAAKALARGGEDLQYFFATKPNYAPRIVIPEPPDDLPEQLHEHWRNMHIEVLDTQVPENLISNGRMTSVFDLKATCVPFYYDDIGQ